MFWSRPDTVLIGAQPIQEFFLFGTDFCYISAPGSCSVLKKAFGFLIENKYQKYFKKSHWSKFHRIGDSSQPTQPTGKSPVGLRIIRLFRCSVGSPQALLVVVLRRRRGQRIWPRARARHHGGVGRVPHLRPQKKSLKYPFLNVEICFMKITNMWNFVFYQKKSRKQIFN